MKEILDTAFQHEVSQVFEGGVRGVHFKYQLSVFAGGKEIVAQNVLGTHRDRDYINNFMDLHSVSFTVTKYQLEKQIHPFATNLEVQLVETQVTNNPALTGHGQTFGARKVYRYKAIMMDESRDLISQNNPFLKDPDVLSRMDVEKVTVQLLDKTTEKLRLVEVSGNFRGKTGIDLIRTILTKYSAEASNQASSSILGVDIADNYNEEIREQINISQQIPLSAVPQYVSDNCGGIYAAGFSYFLQDRIWYLFAPYDVKRYKRVQRNLTIVNLPKDRLAGLEKTYRRSNTQVVVLSTGEVKHINNADANTMNYGNGSRWFDPRRLFNNGKMENNRYRVNAAENINQVKIRDRDDGSVIAPKSSYGITTNKNRELSELAARAGSLVQVSWENSDDSLIYPGMPVRFLYLDNNRPTEAYGIVQGIETFKYQVNNNFAEPKFASASAITVFIENPRS